MLTSGRQQSKPHTRKADRKRRFTNFRKLLGLLNSSDLQFLQWIIFQETSTTKPKLFKKKKWSSDPTFEVREPITIKPRSGNPMSTQNTMTNIAIYREDPQTLAGGKRP